MSTFEVLKQLRENPSDRSIILGWKLLLRLCQQVQPNPKLEEFVRSFLMQGIKSSNPEVQHIAKQCVRGSETPRGMENAGDLR